jgi:hypothetical protein
MPGFKFTDNMFCNWLSYWLIIIFSTKTWLGVLSCKSPLQPSPPKAEETCAVKSITCFAVYKLHFLPQHLLPGKVVQCGCSRGVLQAGQA